MRFRTLTEGSAESAISMGLRHIKGEMHGQIRLLARIDAAGGRLR